MKAKYVVMMLHGQVNIGMILHGQVIELHSACRISLHNVC